MSYETFDCPKCGSNLYDPLSGCVTCKGRGPTEEQQRTQRLLEERRQKLEEEFRAKRREAEAQMERERQERLRAGRVAALRRVQHERQLCNEWVARKLVVLERDTRDLTAVERAKVVQALTELAPLYLPGVQVSPNIRKARGALWGRIKKTLRPARRRAARRQREVRRHRNQPAESPSAKVGQLMDLKTLEELYNAAMEQGHATTRDGTATNGERSSFHKH